MAAVGLSNVHVGQRVGLSREAVRLWRDLWVSLAAAPLKELSIADRLADAPRSGAPPHIRAELVCAIITLACEAPSQAGCPITQWTGRDLADEITRRGSVATISPRHAARLLTRGIFSRIWSATG